MVKFLLSLPLGIFIIAEAIIVYMLGDIIFKAATVSTAAALVGKWDFFQILLAMIGIIVGIILAAFFYSTVVLKPVFYPPSEEDKPKKQKRTAAPEPKKKSKKTLIIILIIGAIVIALVLTGLFFRKDIFEFIGSFTSPEDNITDEDGGENEEGGEDENNTDDELTEPESEPALELEPEFPALYEDLEYNWIMYYPASLGETNVAPFETAIFQEPSDINPKLLYWSTDNVNGYTGALDYAEADPSGILAVSGNSQIIDDNTIVCRVDLEDSEGMPFSSVRFWYIDPSGIASADISCETAEKADEWYASLINGAIYIEKTNPAE